MPYYEAAQKERPKGNARKSGNPSKRAAAATSQAAAQEQADAAAGLGYQVILKMLMQMYADMENAPVHDVLIQAPEGIRAVLTVSSQYFSEATNERLRAGDFTVLGKATRILKDSGSINLARRTMMRVSGQDAAQSMIFAAAESVGIAREEANSIVTAPAIQIVPMAIFI